MPRSKPFSGKAKKNQLKNKRQEKINKSSNIDPTDALFAHIEEFEAKVSEAKTQNDPKLPKQTRVISPVSNDDRVPYANDEQVQDEKVIETLPTLFKDIESIQNSFGKFFLKLEKLTKTEVEERKFQARTVQYNCDQDSKRYFPFRQDITWPDFPTRPEWHKNMSPFQLEKSESDYFIKFINEISKDQNSHKNLNKFEHNLETWRQLWRVVEKSNCIAIVVDSRFPHLTLADSLLKYLKSPIVNKYVILILNKSDLIPVNTAAKLVNFYQTNKFYNKYIDKVVLFTSPKRDLKLSKKNFNFLKDNYHLGPADLLDCLQEKFPFIENWKEADLNNCKIHNNGTRDVGQEDNQATLDYQCNLGFLGFPNVGKSSVMNRLIGKKITRISSTPGATKYFQTYFPENSKNIQLIDCPGLVFPAKNISFPEQILAGSYPISQVQEPYTTIGELLVNSNLLNELKLEKINKQEENFNYDYSKITAWQVCELFSCQKGFYTGKGGGTFDVYKAANKILRSVVNGEYTCFTDLREDEGKYYDLTEYLENLRESEKTYLEKVNW